jgi:flagellar biosynthesis GTPase FlhF
LSILGYSFHTFNNFIEVVASVNLIQLHIISLTLFGFLYTLFWFSSGIALSQVVRHCAIVNEVFNFGTNFTCDGEIVSMTFAYINFIIWSIMLWKGIVEWSNRYDNHSLNIHLQNIESPIQQETQPVQQEETQQVQQEETQQVQQEETQQVQQETQQEETKQEETQPVQQETQQVQQETQQEETQQEETQPVQQETQQVQEQTLDKIEEEQEDDETIKE